MRKLSVAALCAAGVVACAGPAGATIMLAEFSGDYSGYDTTGAFGPIGHYYTWWDGSLLRPDAVGYDVRIVFDSNLGVTTTLSNSIGQYQSLDWSLASGSSSPIISATVSINGSWHTDYCGPNCIRDVTNIHQQYDISDLNSITISRPGTHLSISLVTASGDTIADTTGAVNGLPPQQFARIDQPFLDQQFSPTGGPILIPGFSTAQTSASLTILGPSPVPEPATWAMLLLGFFGISSVLRRQRGHLGALAREATFD